MQASAQVKEFIKSYEKTVLTPYRDQAGNWTNGTGHLLAANDPRETWTPELACKVFDADIAEVEAGLADLISVELRQHEFDALVSFAFNVGVTAFKNSTLRRVLNESDFVTAALELGRWGRAGVVWSAGLLRRRIGEMAIFLLADYSRTP